MKKERKSCVLKRKHKTPINKELNFSPLPKRETQIEKSIFSPCNFTDIPNSETKQPYTLLSSRENIKIYLVQNIFTKNLYIRKTIKISSIPNYSAYISKMLSIYKNLKHDNILKLYSSLKKNDDIIELYYEYAQKGNLKEMIIHNGVFNEERSFGIFFQLLDVMMFLHSKNIILRNLTPENILIGNNDKVYIYDFSQTQIFNKKNKFYDYSDDIWNLGLILYLLTQGINAEKTGKFERDIQFECHNEISKECKELITMLLNENDIQTVEQIMNHIWVRKFMDDTNSVIVKRFGEFAKEKVERLKKIRKGSSKSNTKLNSNVDEESIYWQKEKILGEARESTVSVNLFNDMMHLNTAQSRTDNYASNPVLNEYSTNTSGIKNIMSRNKNLIIPQKKSFWDNFKCFGQDDYEL